MGFKAALLVAILKWSRTSSAKSLSDSFAAKNFKPGL